MGTTTIGVAIAVPEPYGRLLQEARAGFGDPEAYAIPTHVTLLPPTEVTHDLLPSFRRHLARIALHSRPFAMRLCGTATFRPRSPVVYARVVEGGGRCAELQERVRSGPVARELEFPYHPHVTVAHRVEEAALDRAERELAGFGAHWTAPGFALYAQGADGVWRASRYFPFGAEDRASPPVGLPQQLGTREASRL